MAVGDRSALEQQAARMFSGILGDTHLSRPDELTTLLVARSREIGVEEVVVYLVDYEQEDLIPMPGPGAEARAVQRIDGTMAGRSFAHQLIQDLDADRP